MIIDWVTAKAQQFLPEQDAGLDELNVSLDFALSPEIMELLYAQDEACTDAGQQDEAENATVIRHVGLDEYELALT
jgi:hypothetical protein